MNLPGFHIQRCVKRKCSMAVILETVPLGAARRKRQYRIQTIKSLDGALLVNAEYSGVHRRFEVLA